MASRTARRKQRDLVVRLSSAMYRDRQALKPYRDNRLAALKAYAGYHYSNRAADAEQPCNFLNQFVRAITVACVAKAPRWHLTTWNRKLEPVVAAAERWANKESERQRVDLTFQRVVTDACFCLGIAKVALASPADAALRGGQVKAGEPFIDPIDFDDWICDTFAQSFEQFAYEGHRFRVPLEAVLESDLYEEKAKKHLSESSYRWVQDTGEERGSAMGVEQTGPDVELEPMVDLWSIYLPRQKKMLTLAADAGGLPPSGEDETIILRDAEWIGPECGPYHHLALGAPPPGSLLPVAPVMNVLFPNRVLNDLARKLVGQAGRQKSLSVGRLGNNNDAEAVKRASDGEMILLSDPDSVKELRYGGPDPVNAQFFELYRNLFNKLAGNLEVLLGLGSESPTATQENILNANSSRMVADYQESTANFIAKTGRSWMWWAWNHPFMRMRSIYEAPHGMREFDREITNFPNREEFRSDPQTAAMVRSGPFDDLDVRIDPYSIRFTTPEKRAEELLRLMTQVVVPMTPALSQQQIGADLNAFFDLYGKYKDMPELPKILHLVPPPAEAQAEGQAETNPVPSDGPTTVFRRSAGSGDGGSGVKNNPAEGMMAAASDNKT